MPKAKERALRKAGRAKGYTGKRLDNFVYGTMTNQGWRRGKKKHAKKKAKRARRR